MRDHRILLPWQSLIFPLLSNYVVTDYHYYCSPRSTYVIEVYHDSTAQIVAENDKSPAPNDFKAGLLDFFSFKMTQM